MTIALFMPRLKPVVPECEARCIKVTKCGIRLWEESQFTSAGKRFIAASCFLLEHFLGETGFGARGG